MGCTGRASGPLADVIVADASVLYEVVVGGRDTARIARTLATDDEPMAPHVIDAEVSGASGTPTSFGERWTPRPPRSRLSGYACASA